MREGEAEIENSAGKLLPFRSGASASFRFQTPVPLLGTLTRSRKARDKSGTISLVLSAYICLSRLPLPLSENIIQRYGSLPGVLHMIELEKGKTGLGLSLAGNRDRSRMSVFVVGIDPKGAAGRDGRMVVGDELLEVRCVLNLFVFSL